MRKSNLRATAGWQTLALLGAGVIVAAPAAAQDAGTQTCPDGRVIASTLACTPPESAADTGETAPSSETQPSASQQATVGTDPVAAADSDDAIVVTGSRIARPLAGLAHPERPLQRGFARVTDRHGKTILHAGNAREVALLTLRFADGSVEATVDGAGLRVEQAAPRSYRPARPAGGTPPQPGLFDE